MSRESFLSTVRRYSAADHQWLYLGSEAGTAVRMEATGLLRVRLPDGTELAASLDHLSIAGEGPSVAPVVGTDEFVLFERMQEPSSTSVKFVPGRVKLRADGSGEAIGYADVLEEGIAQAVITDQAAIEKLGLRLRPGGWYFLEPTWSGDVLLRLAPAEPSPLDPNVPVIAGCVEG